MHGLGKVSAGSDFETAAGYAGAQCETGKGTWKGRVTELTGGQDTSQG